MTKQEKDEQKVIAANGRLVEDYFSHVKELWEGCDGTVEKFMSLWDPDGTFEFTGSPAVEATFRGANAIQVLYRNRSRANGMGVRLAPQPKTAKGLERFVVLANLRPNLRKHRASPDGAVASWNTQVQTGDGQGFEMIGNHQFTIRNGKITHLKVTITPKPREVEGLSMEDLTVADIGRLSLAAWAVV